MLKILQKVAVYNISKFEAATKAMKQSGNQPWIQKISKGQKDQLWALYKQATEGDAKEQLKQGMSPREVDMNRSQQTKSNIEHDQQQYEAWSKYTGKPKQQAQSEYAILARDLLTKHKAEKYIKDF